MADRYGERYRGEGYERDRHRGRDDRGFIDRAGDEVRSWFGDDEAARRRERDIRHEPFGERGRDQGRAGYERSGRDVDPSWERRGGYGADEPRRHETAERRGGEPEWRASSGTGSYGGYTGTTGAQGWTGGYNERQVESRDRYNMYDDGRLTTGYQYPPAGTPATSASWGRGRFAGRGPKGYQRSDDRIREDVCDRLTDDPDIDASDIEIAVSRGEVTLSGTVREREDKRRAEDLIERISGVNEVHNMLRVNRSDAATPGSVLGVSGSAGTSARASTDVNTPGTRR